MTSKLVDIEILPVPGVPQERSIDLQISPQYATELANCLREAGVVAEEVIKHSAEQELVTLMVELGQSGLTLGAVAVGLKVFFHRHDGKKIKLGGMELTGFSPEKSEQIAKDLLEDVVKKWEANNAHYQEMLTPPEDLTSD